MLKVNVKFVIEVINFELRNSTCERDCVGNNYKTFNNVEGI